jgi:transcriptional regulator with XRE-family HTH domain
MRFFKPVVMAIVRYEKLFETGSNIRKWRILKNMKQEDLAEEIDISLVSLSKIENGKTNIPLSRLFDIAVALGIHIQLLFSDPFIVIQQRDLKDKNELSNFWSLKDINS